MVGVERLGHRAATDFVDYAAGESLSNGLFELSAAIPLHQLRNGRYGLTCRSSQLLGHTTLVFNGAVFAELELGSNIGDSDLKAYDHAEKPRAALARQIKCCH